MIDADHERTVRLEVRVDRDADDGDFLEVEAGAGTHLGRQPDFVINSYANWMPACRSRQLRSA